MSRPGTLPSATASPVRSSPSPPSRDDAPGRWRVALPRPQVDLRVEAALARRVEVYAANDAGLIRRHDRVGKGAAALELFLVPAEVDQVLFKREAVRPPAIRPDVRKCAVLLLTAS